MAVSLREAEDGLQTDDGEGAITIEEDRLERLIGAVSLASAGAFKEATRHLDPVEPDRFGYIEESLRIFLTELEASKEQAELALAKLQAAKLDLEQKLETIDRQQLAIQELSTPIIDVWDDILTLPVIGLMNEWVEGLERPA